VVKVFQGDMIQVIGKEGKFSVRLAGIDAPEFYVDNPQLSQPFAKKAKDYLASLIQDKYIRIKAYGGEIGKYVIGKVFLGSKNINLEMIKAGYAEVYRGKSPPKLNLEPYRIAESKARSAKTGMWVQGKDYESPWAWCKRKRAKGVCSIILFGILQQGAGKK